MLFYAPYNNYILTIEIDISIDIDKTDEKNIYKRYFINNNEYKIIIVEDIYGVKKDINITEEIKYIWLMKDIVINLVIHYIYNETNEDLSKINKHIILYNNNGTKFKEYNLKNGKIDGIHKEYDSGGDNNETYEEIIYKNDEIIETHILRYSHIDTCMGLFPCGYDGYIKKYYNNILQFECYVVDNDFTGEYKEYYHLCGKLHKKYNYINGEVNGLYTTYYKNGNIKTQTIIENNSIKNFYIKYNENGEIIEEYKLK